MEKRRNEQHKRRSAGESMLMVVIMMLVFFLLGAAVMTAASTSTAAASARVIERQGYYYARSMMDTLDASLQKGELGKALEEALISDILKHNEGTGATRTWTYTQLEPFTLVYHPQFSDAPLSELNSAAAGSNDVTITCVGRGMITLNPDNSPYAVTLNRMRVMLSYACTYRDITTQMFIQYRYTYTVQHYGEQGVESWTRNWDIKSAG